MALWTTKQLINVQKCTKPKHVNNDKTRDKYFNITLLSEFTNRVSVCSFPRFVGLLDKR